MSALPGFDISMILWRRLGLDLWDSPKPRVAVTSPLAQTTYFILSYSVRFVRQTAASQLGELFAEEVPGYFKYDLSGLTHPLAAAQPVSVRACPQCYPREASRVFPQDSTAELSSCPWSYDSHTNPAPATSHKQCANQQRQSVRH